MIKIIVLIGPSGCGKDYFRKLACKEFNLYYLKPYTTRKQRNNESSEDYFFNGMVPGNYMILESRNYKLADNSSVSYGTTFPHYIEDGSICITCGTIEMLINIINSLQDIDRNKLVIYINGKEIDVCIEPIFIKTEPSIRLSEIVIKRSMLSCEDPNEICRRFLADSKDFSDEVLIDFESHYTTLRDNNSLKPMDIFYNSYDNASILKFIDKVKDIAELTYEDDYKKEVKKHTDHIYHIMEKYVNKDNKECELSLEENRKLKSIILDDLQYFSKLLKIRESELLSKDYKDCMWMYPFNPIMEGMLLPYRLSYNNESMKFKLEYKK